jgi:hypothetical protein
MNEEQLYCYLDTLEACSSLIGDDDSMHNGRLEEIKWILSRMYKQKVEEELQ